MPVERKSKGEVTPGPATFGGPTVKFKKSETNRNTFSVISTVTARIEIH